MLSFQSLSLVDGERGRDSTNRKQHPPPPPPRAFLAFVPIGHEVVTPSESVIGAHFPTLPVGIFNESLLPVAVDSTQSCVISPTSPVGLLQPDWWQISRPKGVGNLRKVESRQD